MVSATRIMGSPPIRLEVETSNLHLSRILALHGGGTNKRIFRAQCRVLEASFKAHGFRLVYAEAPFPSVPGPDVVSVYSEWGPFKAWLRSPDVIVPERQDIHAIEDAISSAMHADNQLGANGALVGVMGFSQGGRVAASLLLQQQQRRVLGGLSFGFGLLLAARGPLLDLSPEFKMCENHTRLSIPTVHVHGLSDPGLECHRQMYEFCCDLETTRLVLWDGGHRLPIKTTDVKKVVSATIDMAKCAESLKVSPWCLLSHPRVIGQDQEDA